MEQTIDLNDLKKLLPDQAKLTFQRKKGGTGKHFLEVDVRITPAIPEAEWGTVVNNILHLYGEDLIELYTEETGHWFYVYLRMSSTQPVTVKV